MASCESIIFYIGMPLLSAYDLQRTHSHAM